MTWKFSSVVTGSDPVGTTVRWRTTLGAVTLVGITDVTPLPQADVLST